MPRLRLGLIGLGAFGSRIATRLLRTGFSLEIYDIADVALRMFNMDVGGIITGSPKMMAQACNVIITVLPSAAEVREVAFEWEGLARGLHQRRRADRHGIHGSGGDEQAGRRV